MSIYNLINQVREHPDCIAIVAFTKDDPSEDNAPLDVWMENRKWIEEAMCRAGFQTAEDFDV